jgi:hypothetical protein
LKVELKSDDLKIILLSLNAMTIKGSDSGTVSSLINRVGKSYEKAIESESKNG